MKHHVHQGLTLPTHKRQSRAVAIATAAVPDLLVLPLNQHGDATLQPSVQVDAVVLMGQPIATPIRSHGAYLHSPVSGRVIAIESRPSIHGDTTLSIVIANDHEDRIDPTLQPMPDWSSQDPLMLCEQLARGGMVGLGGAVFPTATKLAMHCQYPIEHLLLNGVECEPYISCDDRLMRERAEHILQGAQILLHAAHASHCKIAIETDKAEALAAMRAAAATLGDSRIDICPVVTAYPKGDEGQLIAQLLGREIPRGGLPAHIGVMVQNVATAYACARWILAAEPLISRIVTVAGDGVANAANLETRIGTPIASLIEYCGGYTEQASALIMGGAMMGQSLSDDSLPIVKASNCYIVGTANEVSTHVEERPCIRCGECMHACPVDLLPQQLLWHILTPHPFALQQLGLQDCIECGCCDLVCPSHIQLAKRFHLSKSSQTLSLSASPPELT